MNWHATSGSTPTTSSLYASSILRLKVVLDRLILRNARTQDTIRLAARHFGIQHREYYVTPDDLVRTLPARHPKPCPMTEATRLPLIPNAPKKRPV